MPEETIADTVAYFGVPPEGSARFNDFVEERLGERPVQACYGIGDAAVAALKRNGITKAWQLMGLVLYTPKEDVVKKLEDPEFAGVPKGWGKRVALSLLMNHQKHQSS